VMVLELVYGLRALAIFTGVLGYAIGRWL
jgi:hypothetical protein